jgi:L-malate glycosyltransferase
MMKWIAKAEGLLMFPMRFYSRLIKSNQPQRNSARLKVILIGALPPPTGGDAIWATNFLTNEHTRDIKFIVINTSLIGRRAADIGRNYRIGEELIRALRIWVRTLWHLISFRPNIIHINTNCAPLGVIRDFITICIVRCLFYHVHLHCHSNVTSEIFSSRKLSRVFLILCLRLSKKVLVLNNASANYCKAISNVNCVNLPNFINESEIVAGKNICDNIKTILFVGHVIKTKGVYEILEVARRFPKISFIMAGLVGIQFEDGFVPLNVIMLGDLDRFDVRKLMFSADLFLFPTYTEGFSMALLEAMGNGLPIIATPVGANSEMLEGKGGKIIPVGDVEAICAAIDLLGDPRLRKLYSIWNISKVKKKYSSREIICQIRKIYSEE